MGYGPCTLATIALAWRQAAAFELAILAQPVNPEGMTKQERALWQEYHRGFRLDYDYRAEVTEATLGDPRKQGE